MSAPATDWKEIVPEGEAEELEAFARELREVQRRRAAKHGAAGRSLHFKGHVNVEATLEVREGLAPHLAHGLFARPARYRAFVRFSNGVGFRQPDRTGDVRGMAIKVLGVPGRKIIAGLEDATTQDFLLIHSPSTPFVDAKEFVGVVVAASGSPLLILPRLASRVGLARAMGLLRRIVSGLGRPFASFAGQSMYGALPIQYGPYAARYALLPVGAPEPIAALDHDDALAADLAAHVARGPLAWDLAVQLFVDEARTPIEDGSVEWKEADAPFEIVARLEIPQQDVRSPRGERASQYIETLSFDPWHALVEHRPLGNLMRARNHAYRHSTEERGAAPEPVSADIA